VSTNSTATMAAPAAWRVVRLVAGREIYTRLRSKAFMIATAVTVIALAVLAIISSLAGGSSASSYNVGVTPATASLSGPLSAIASSAGATVTIRSVPDEATGRTEVKDGKLDALMVGDGRSVDVVVKGDTDATFDSAMQLLSAQLALNKQITQLGGDPAAVSAAIQTAKVTVQKLEPPHPVQNQQIALGVITGILIYMSLMLNGQQVAQGVVEEKSSRVVELLLATVRPWQLMAGKVLGIGVVGLLQMVIIAGSGVVMGLVTGSLHLSASAAAGTVIWLVVWYLLGFFAYALAFAAVAALVSRQEDVTGVVVPVLMFVVVGYILGIVVLPTHPNSHLLGVLSMVPTFAPTLMSMRMAMGGVPVWQAVVSVAGMVAVVPLLVWMSGRIYRNAVMRSGARVRLRDAWRAA
jgi:ABC-2 type transport system permease protein